MRGLRHECEDGRGGFCQAASRMDISKLGAVTGAVLAMVACGGGGGRGSDAVQSGAGAAASDGGGTGAAASASGAGSGASSTADPNFYVFLLIGQSNMEGQAKP